ncbi:MAG: FAD-dependent oxidoreductase [Planctomycetes bacterium]|nr:FAD-dependent oxidoreductase [Planctomycetota bacterium]
MGIAEVTLTRRELIAILLGSPALLTTGCSTVPHLPPAGELLGQSLEIGHRLRDGFRWPSPDTDQWQDVGVVIVGGGVAGLSAAWRLKQNGCEDFVILELESQPGGTSRSGRCELTPYPWGAHYLPVPLPHNRDLIRLLEEMGCVESLNPDGSPVIAEQFLCRDPDERVFVNGQWIEGLYPSLGASNDDFAQLAAFRQEIDRWTAWRDTAGRRAFSIPIRHSTDDAEVLELDKLSMAEWLRQHEWTSPRLHWLVDYSCRDDYGLTAEQTSAWAGVLYFAARLKEPGADHQPLMTWPHGNGRIIEYLASQADTRLKPGIAVTRINPSHENPNATLEVLAFDTASEQPIGFHAKSVIFAAPQFLAPRLIDGFAERTGRSADPFEYGSWLVANVHLRHRPRESSFPLSWDNVIHDSRSLGYVVATHQSGDDHGPTVLTWYHPLCDDDVKAARQQLLKAKWSDLADVVLTDLEHPHPEIRELVTRLDVFRWGHAMIRPRPGFITSRHRRDAAQPDGRIHFANTDLSGIALFEEAFDHGLRAADEVLVAQNSRPSSLIPCR